MSKGTLSSCCLRKSDNIPDGMRSCQEHHQSIQPISYSSCNIMSNHNFKYQSHEKCKISQGQMTSKWELYVRRSYCSQKVLGISKNTVRTMYTKEIFREKSYTVFRVQVWNYTSELLAIDIETRLQFLLRIVYYRAPWHPRFVFGFKGTDLFLKARRREKFKSSLFVSWQIGRRSSWNIVFIYKLCIIWLAEEIASQEI